MYCTADVFKAAFMLFVIQALVKLPCKSFHEATM